MTDPPTVLPSLRALPFALTLREESGRKWAFPFQVAKAALIGTVATLGLLYILRGSPDWPTRQPLFLVAVIGLPIATLVNIWLVYWIEGKRVVSLNLTGEGLSIITLRAGAISLRWNSPNFAFSIHFRGEGTNDPKPVVVWAGQVRPATQLTLQSAESLVEYARARGLDVGEPRMGVGKYQSRSIQVRPAKSATRAV